MLWVTDYSNIKLSIDLPQALECGEIYIYIYSSIQLSLNDHQISSTLLDLCRASQPETSRNQLVILNVTYFGDEFSGSEASLSSPKWRCCFLMSQNLLGLFPFRTNSPLLRELVSGSMFVAVMWKWWMAKQTDLEEFVEGHWVSCAQGGPRGQINDYV